MRGFNLSSARQPGLTDADFAGLADYKANLVRIGVVATLDAQGAFELAAGEWHYIQKTLAMGQRHGFKVVVTLTPVPWGEQSTFWDNARQQDSLVALWARVAALYRGHPVIAGYDLINEPVMPKDRTAPSGPATDIWRALAVRMIQAIRAEDANSVVIFQPSPWGLPKAFGSLVPLPFARVVYSFHLYAPHSFTQ